MCIRDSNGTTRVPSDYAGILRDLGFPVEDGSVLTPASAAVDLFHQLGYRRVMVLGGDGLSVPLRDAGIEVVPRVRDSGAEAVLVGWFRDCLLYTSPSPRDRTRSRMPSS